MEEPRLLQPAPPRDRRHLALLHQAAGSRDPRSSGSADHRQRTKRHREERGDQPRLRHPQHQPCCRHHAQWSHRYEIRRGRPARRHNQHQVQGFCRSELRRVPRSRRKLQTRGRDQRLLRQGPLRRSHLYPAADPQQLRSRGQHHRGQHRIVWCHLR